MRKMIEKDRFMQFRIDPTDEKWNNGQVWDSISLPFLAIWL